MKVLHVVNKHIRRRPPQFTDRWRIPWVVFVPFVYHTEETNRYFNSLQIIYCANYLEAKRVYQAVIEGTLAHWDVRIWVERLVHYRREYQIDNAVIEEFIPEFLEYIKELAKPIKNAR